MEHPATVRGASGLNHGLLRGQHLLSAKFSKELWRREENDRIIKTSFRKDETVLPWGMVGLRPARTHLDGIGSRHLTLKLKHAWPIQPDGGSRSHERPLRVDRRMERDGASADLTRKMAPHVRTRIVPGLHAAGLTQYGRLLRSDRKSQAIRVAGRIGYQNSPRGWTALTRQDQVMAEVAPRTLGVDLDVARHRRCDIDFHETFRFENASVDVLDFSRNCTRCEPDTNCSVRE